MEDTDGELTVKSQLLDGQLLFPVNDAGVGLANGGGGSDLFIFSAFFTTKLRAAASGLDFSRSIAEAQRRPVVGDRYTTDVEQPPLAAC